MEREEILAYAAARAEETAALTEALCRIPAPSGKERNRAEFCKDWLERHGARKVRIDDADNAVLELNAEDSRALTVVTAHTDTVFPDTEPMEPRRAGDRLLCPGAGDDTANLAALLMAARCLLEQGIRPERGLVIAANSGEEGLGNLRGCRRLMEAYRGRVARMISFDGYLDRLWNRAVGSSRFRISVRTQGGHSFRDFGTPNAIVRLSELIEALYAVRPCWGPPETVTTYNVGAVCGGTSVNTIAQEASMLYEYRSDDAAGLRGMDAAFRAAVETVRAKGTDVEIVHLGTRPCGEGVDPAAQQALTALCGGILQAHTGRMPVIESASTDCNIPLSLGIPAVSFGLCRGGGAHTREEWVELSSLETGIAAAVETLLAVSR
jgi:acetylornithine deacetylase/succinyl-diaminopimelate desuccinylase-like protein